VDLHTTQLIGTLTTLADDLLEQIENVSKELELKRATSYWWWLKSIVIWILSFIGALLALLVILVLFSEEEDIQWILMPLRSIGNDFMSSISKSSRSEAGTKGA